MERNFYVYRITNKILLKHYIGFRCCSINPKDDLGKKYFSSSRDSVFIKDQKENPDNYKYKILKIFSNKVDALNYEIFLHNKYEVGVNEKFFNRAKQTSRGFDRTGVHYQYIINVDTKILKQIPKDATEIPPNFIKGASVCSKLSKMRCFNNGIENEYFDIFQDKIPTDYELGYIHMGHSHGKTIANDGINEYFVTEDEISELGLNKGRLNTFMFSSIKNKRMYNNGVIEKYFIDGTNPKDFKLGCLPGSYRKDPTIHSEETKEKIKKNHADFSGSNHPRAIKYILTSPDGLIYKMNGNLVKFCKENGLNYGILKENIGKRVQKKVRIHKAIGWKLEYDKKDY